MSEHTLSALLTFVLLAGGTAAIGSEMFGTSHNAAAPKTAQVRLPTVIVTAHQPVPLASFTLPTVTVVGHRDAATRLAVETRASEPRRLE